MCTPSNRLPQRSGPTKSDNLESARVLTICRLNDASALPAAHRVRFSSFVKHRSSLATEAIRSQLIAIIALNRISSLAESSKRFTFYVSPFTSVRPCQPPTRPKRAELMAYGVKHERIADNVWPIACGTDNQQRAPIFVVLVLDAPVLWEIGFPAGVDLVEEVRLGWFRVGPCGS